jgi:hypothetical protein
LGRGSARSGKNFLVGEKGFPRERKELPSGDKGHSPGRGFVKNERKFLTGRRALRGEGLLWEQRELPVGRRGAPQGREVSLRRYVPKGRVKL